MRGRSTILLLSAVLAGVTAQRALSSAGQTIRCSETVGNPTRFPYIGTRKLESRYRLVLGVISVPPAFTEHVYETRGSKWPYWRKAGLVIRASGESVTITVPKAWRSRAAIQWGNTGGYVVRINSCGSSTTVGNGYAGGFLLRSRAVCLPLTFHVRGRSATVRFGLGRRCGSR